MVTLRHFKIAEFDSPDAPGSGAQMDMTFLLWLDIVRETAGIPFKINSGFRTKAHNAKVGGVQNSAHLRGLAVDVAANAMETRYKIVQAAIKHGCRRIGIAKTFVHLDNDDSLPAGIYLY